tara:strand:- start:1493 stop:1864 length:372 start_codon:yes stop_codon:yes gene_type:complete
MFALTGPNSLSSTGSFEKSKVTELNFDLFDKLFNSKETKQKLELNFTSCFSGLNVAHVFISRRSTLKNGIRKITLKYCDNKGICPFYFYDRGGSVSAASGDLAIHINNIILSFDKPSTNLRLK